MSQLFIISCWITHGNSLGYLPVLQLPIAQFGDERAGRVFIFHWQPPLPSTLVSPISLFSHLVPLVHPSKEPTSANRLHAEGRRRSIQPRGRVLGVRAPMFVQSLRCGCGLRLRGSRDRGIEGDFPLRATRHNEAALFERLLAVVSDREPMAGDVVTVLALRCKAGFQLGAPAERPSQAQEPISLVVRRQGPFHRLSIARLG